MLDWCKLYFSLMEHKCLWLSQTGRTVKALCVEAKALDPRAIFEILLTNVNVTHGLEQIPHKYNEYNSLKPSEKIQCEVLVVWLLQGSTHFRIMACQHGDHD